jgi:hypothetical protein
MQELWRSPGVVASWQLSQGAAVVSVQLSEKRTSGGGWLEYAIFALDRRIRRRLGVYEYTTNAQCLFRIQLDRAEHGFSLSDGTQVSPGDPILKLHLWNEQLPLMGQHGPTVAWARQASRALDNSLRELARYLAERSELANIAVICGDMSLGTAQQCEKLVRIVARYGFEAAADRKLGRPGILRRIGDCIVIFMLVLVVNPVALRGSILRHVHKRIVLSRAALERRYAGSRASRPVV